ncbi:MurR/RpiR family transcriptional regulator [Massilia sp. TS11]|uniref:MurR/RpiR family transcriptional regulator n=1 Tax=Massilia sp. TS11 TaxID=2908003 RepID=UPI001EDB8D0C|nr:MurR/RpiR family transcriptional regulator [Massilia sp. TS11]MCG2586222.1 MurR/RpiR family transcriptional regulator [Massilia sp. TS11]
MTKSGSAASPDIAFAESSLGQRLLKVLAEGSNSQRHIADYLLRHQMRVTAIGIEELAEACQVSTATISRFARDIGYRNYSAMRSAVAETLQAVLQPVDKLRSTIERGQGDGTPAAQSLAYAGANISSAAQAMDQKELDKVVAKLTKARAVYVMGFGLSAHLAGLLTLHLQPFCSQVVEVVSYGGTEVAAGHLASIGPRDVLLTVSFPRYALDVIRLSTFARDRKACVVALTDAPASPLAALSDHVLYAHSTHPILPSSASAAVAVIEALVATLMVSNKANVAKATRLTEAISAYLYGSDLSKP